MPDGEAASRRGPTRRSVLGGGLAALGAATVAACGGGPGRAGRSTRTTVRSTASTPAPDLDALARTLRGSLLRLGAAGFASARLLFNRRFDALPAPAAIARVAGEADIAACVRFARAAGMPLRVRAGGHSYLGASSGDGLVVDLRDLAGVAAGNGTAVVGAGARLVDVYGSLAAQGVSIPAGSCPSVGVGGLALGGGMGVVARAHGLTCDRLTAARVVLADGRVVTASARSEPDLFWALRGGGGSFGVVAAFTFATHPVAPLAIFRLAWPWTDAARVFAGWQDWLASTPRALWSTCHLLATNGATPEASVSGVFIGAAASLQPWIGRLRDAVSRAPASSFVRDEGYAETMLIEAGCADVAAAACRVADFGAGGSLRRDAFVAASDFFARPVAAGPIAAVVAAVEKRQEDPDLGVGGVAFDSWGGAVNDPAPADTAFVHRRALFGAQYTASWQETPGNGPMAANQSSLRAIQAALRPAASGEAYQNYADPTLADALSAYYGANLDRLRSVKKAYDPDDLFSQPQGIRPA